MSALVPIPLVVPPGVIVTDSLRAASGRYSGCDRIRFVNGKPQKVGGNQRVSFTAMSGTPRALLAWADFLQNRYMAAGTYAHLYAFDSGFNLTDITPIQSTGTLNLGTPVTLGSITPGSGYTPGTYTPVLLVDTTTSGAFTPGATIVVGAGGGVTSVTLLASPLGAFSAVGDTLIIFAGTPVPGGSGFSVPVATIGPFITASGSTAVTVQQKNHGYLPGTVVTFAGASTFNSVNMNGTFLVATVVSANEYTVNASTTASAGGAGGGAATTFSAEINPGVEYGSQGVGFGAGPYGLGAYGSPTASNITQIEPRVWSLDHFGYILLAAYQGSTLYSFDPTASEPWSPAVTTFQGTPMNAPTNFRAMFISSERFIFALCDKMVVNVSSQGDPTTWTPATTNTAFSRTLETGTKLVGGAVLAPFLSLVWSDSACFLFQYTGSQYLYNSSMVGKDCGLIAPGAVVTVDGIAYWMGADNFYSYNGTVAPIPRVEEIRKYVLDQMPDNLAYQCFAVYVPKYHEIWFGYPTSGNLNPTNYVIYHINDQCWSIGTLSYYSSVGVTAGRASGTHYTQGDTSPFMAGTDGYIYNHDFVGDTYDDNGQPQPWSLSIAPYAIKESLQNFDIEGIDFDFFQQSGNITAVVNTYDRMTDTSPMDTDTEVIPAVAAGITDFRVAGRFLTLTLSSDDPENYMRMGRPVIEGRPSATRR